MLCFLFKEFREIRKKLIKQYFWPGKLKNYLGARWLKASNYYVYKFLLNLRIFEKLLKKRGFLVKILRWHYLRKYMHYANICGFSIGDSVLGEDVLIYHRANITINPAARVGKGCKFHGDCVIGVAHTGDEKSPILGENVDIGVGAKILGDIYIADNICIGANAVVTRSFTEPGITIAGIPARKISK